MQENKTSSMGREYLTEKQRRKKWKEVVAVLGVFVIIATVSALTLPAVTINHTVCGLEEHQHGDACYALNGEKKLVCTPETIGIHQHTGTCYDGEGNLICGQADFIIHTHDNHCYDSNGSLICTLPEIEEHIHDDGCYEIREKQAESEPQGENQLQGEESKPQEENQLQGEEESEPQEENQLQGEEESEPQEENQLQEEEEEESEPQEENQLQEEDKLQIENELQNEDEIQTEQIEQTESKPYEQERILICQKQEIIEHTHGEGCFIEGENKGAISCQQMEVKRHQHTEECFQTENILTCQIQEHTHTDACVSKSVLTEEEKREVEDVISIIDGLPEVQDAKDEFTKLKEEGSSEELAAYQQKIENAVNVASDYYEALNENQKLEVTNIEKLNEYLKWLKDIGVIEDNRHSAKFYTDSTYTQECEQAVSLTVIGELPDGAEVRSYPVNDVQMQDADVLYACDITIFKEDGTVYQPETPVTVKLMGIPNTNETTEYGIFHVQENGRLEPIESETEGETVSFTAEHFSVYAVMDIQKLKSVAEAADPEAVQELINSGFFTYWSDNLNSSVDLSLPTETNLLMNTNLSVNADSTIETDGIAAYEPSYMTKEANADNIDGGEEATDSNSQIVNPGGEKSDGSVTVSKTIKGTEVENVFDITLDVSTTTNITELQQDPDMAVVIVMDISNTMNEGFGGSTRYKAAVESAEAFLDKFAASNKGYSKIGYVAFNTDAHEIFGLSSCSSAEEAKNLKDQMRQKTGNIITASGYKDSHSRFTNVEAGLKRASDMLANATNSNKYIIFLSDGFPTTYLKRDAAGNVVGYNGYDPYTSSGTKGADGVFYDYVTNYYCEYGTSYSDKAARRAREMATQIKNSGATIFSIGIDVGGQTIAGYDGRSGLSVIDRENSDYELGSATDANAFKTWLRNSIGSGYYYDSTNTEGLKAAYDSIFQELKTITEQKNNLKWIASDPMPTFDRNETVMEFIGFYDKQKNLNVYPPTSNLTGENTEQGENTASFEQNESKISWSLGKSGYTLTEDSSSQKTYHYSLTYRVRLKNEIIDKFAENQPYQTNGTTTLTYQNVTIVDGKETISGDKTIHFPIPQVKGYLSELTFKKVSNFGEVLAGAEFELRHDTKNCSVCRGDNALFVEFNPLTATSDKDGIVKFERIPSGHKYALVETKVPEGYYKEEALYSVEVSYDKIKVTETKSGTTNVWDLTNADELPQIKNLTSVKLPETGGNGVFWYIFSGMAIMLVSLILIYRNKTRRWKENR